MALDSLLPSVPVLLVLKVLDTGPAHGYEIVRRVERLSEGVLALKEGTLYPLLYKMEQGGLVSGAWTARPGARRIRLYTVTPLGRRHLASEEEIGTVRSRGVNRVLNIEEASTSGLA